MHRINGDLDTYRRRMRERGIHVGRPFPPLLDHNRLSLGLPQEMEWFTEVLREFRTKDWV
jgi:histidinol-phosphate aminotransferase